MPYLINALLTLNVIICLFIILLVLMQRPRNEGLGAAFGGGVTEGLFGTQTTHVLAKLTRWLGGMFFVLTLCLGILYSRNFAKQTSPVEKSLIESAVPPPAATPTPVTSLPGSTPGAPDGGVVQPEAPAPGTPAPAPTGGATPAPSSTTPPPAAPEGTPAPGAPTPAAPASTAPAAPAASAPVPAPAASGAPAPEGTPATPVPAPPK